MHDFILIYTWLSNSKCTYHIILAILTIYSSFQISHAQIPKDIQDRSFLTVLVLPYSSKVQDSQQKGSTNKLLVKGVHNEVKRKLLNRGYRVKDRDAILRLPAIAPLVEETDNYRDKISNAIRQQSEIDVIIWVDIKIANFAEQDRSLQLILDAEDKYSAEIYATSPVIESDRRRYSDNTIVKALTREDVQKQIDIFVDQLDSKFLTLLSTGRTVTVKVTVEKGSDYNMNSVVDQSNDDLGLCIETWLRENAARLFTPSRSETYWQVECILPFNSTDGRAVSPTSLSSALRRYCSKLTLDNGKIVNVKKFPVTNSVIQMVLN
ncbi:MAG: DUF6175 family protein [Bacteroidota bacterium]